MKKCLLFILLAISCNSYSTGTFIAENVTITQISNTGSNIDKFVIWTSGGTGPCANRSIHFPASATNSEKVFDRAYSAALTAFASGTKVTIHNYNGPDCVNASYIRLSK
jgi:hypothetical protein